MASLFVIDGGNLVMRAFYGFPADREDHEVDGVRMMLSKIVRDWQPTHLVFALDSREPSFRALAYPEYKAPRKDRSGPSATELQWKLIPHLEQWGILPANAPGYEGDDILATLAVRAQAADSEVTLVSGDGDLLQLVWRGVRVLRPEPKAGMVVADAEYIRTKYGIEPEQFLDYKVLVGDKSDNIPRVEVLVEDPATGVQKMRGVTPKKAATYLRRFQSLEGIYENLAFLPASEGECLLACKEQAFRFRDLVRLRTDVPLDGLDARMSSVQRSVFARSSR